MKPKSLEEVAQIVDSEGLGYAITDYLSPENIEDEGLRELWLQAQTHLNLIEQKLAPYSEEM